VKYGQNENLLCVCEDLQNNPKNEKRLPGSNDGIPVERTTFEDIAETKPATQAVSNNITERDFKRCFQQWEKRCTLCVHPVGDYPEGKNTTSK